MANTLDVFEISPDGSSIWRGCAETLSSAVTLMNEVTAKRRNEVRIIDLSTNCVVSSSNDDPTTDGKTKLG